MKHRKCAALPLTLLAVAGCSEKSTAPPGEPPLELLRTIDDLNYVRGRFFLVPLPDSPLQTGATIDLSTFLVFVDDGNDSNDQNSRFGYGELDPTVKESPRVVGAFDLLQPLTDYEVTVAPHGDRFPVLVLKAPLSPNSSLGVAYQEVFPGGTRVSVGIVPDCTGASCDSVHLCLLQAPLSALAVKPDQPDFWETDYQVAPLNQVREHELRNVYDLQTSNLPEQVDIQVRRYNALLDESNNAVNDNGEILPYVQILGIDCFKDNGAGEAVPGADLVVDDFPYAAFLDRQRGLLFFPDLRPFDPRIGGRPDARPGDDEFFRSRVPNVDTSIPGIRKRVLWPAGMANPPGSNAPITPVSLQSNPNVYAKKNIHPAVDRRYYIYAHYTLP